MDLDFDKLFKPILYALDLNGGDPYRRRDLRWFIKFFILHIVLYELMLLLLVYNLVEYGIKKRDLIRFCGDGTIILMNIVINCMYGVLLTYQNTFRDLMELLKADYEHAKKLPVDEMNVVLKYANRGQFVTMWWCRIVFYGAWMYPLTLVGFTIHSAITGDFYVADFYPLHMPYLEDRSPLRYVVANFLFGFGVVYTCVMYNGLVPLGPVLMLHASGQLALLETRVMTLFPDNGISPEVTHKKIRDVAKRLREIYSFVENIQTAFQGLYDITLKGTAFVLPLLAASIVQAMKNTRIPQENPVAIFIGAVLFGSFPCYFSDKLLEQSNSFRDAIYNCGWEKYYDRESRLTLLVILTRTSRPIVIRTMFRVVCLDTLASVFKEAYTIFNLLLTVI